jgi:hypothetical protein
MYKNKLNYYVFIRIFYLILFSIITIKLKNSNVKTSTFIGRGWSGRPGLDYLKGSKY